MKYLNIIILIIFALSCSTLTTDIQQDPFYDSFFQITRLIMTMEEIDIYKHLPDKKSKEEFIFDFWKKRDPSPYTEINENKIKFEERIAYANQWFEEGRGSKDKRMGWNTTRGRIFLQLGPPTLRKMGEQEYTNRFTGQLLTTRRDPVEIWEYYQYNFTLAFKANQNGEFQIWGKPPASLGRALREAKNNFNFTTEEGLHHKFKYSVNFKDNQLSFDFPVKNLSFKEDGIYMITEFIVNIHIYVNHEKIDQITKNITLKKKKAGILEKKKLNISILYIPQKKGRYFIETIITEETSSSIYRNFTKFRN